MGDNTEAELRLLVQQIAERAAQGGGMDGPTYDAMIAAMAALSSLALSGERQGREEVLQPMRARLHACEAELHVKAA